MQNYKIERDGKIFSIKRNKYLTPKKNHDGYLRIQIWNKGQCKYVAIHRLVAKEYIPNPNDYPFVNHINGVKNDNRVENLEWCTQKQNVEHAFKNGLRKNQNINSGPLCKEIIQYDLKMNKLREFKSTMDVERTLNIKHNNISYACKHKSIACGCYWSYKKTSND